MKLDNAMQFSSMMLARVQRVPRLMSVDDSKIEMQEVETVVKTPEEIKSETVPLWVVVLSAVAGTIILLLLIFLLYKVSTVVYKVGIKYSNNLLFLARFLQEKSSFECP